MNVELTESQVYNLMLLTAEKACSMNISHEEAGKWSATGRILSKRLTEEGFKFPTLTPAHFREE